VSEQRQTLIEIFKYIVGGLSTTVICWTTVFGLVEIFEIHYLLSVNIATGFVYLYSYMINKVFVFGDRGGQHVVKGSKFILLQVTLLALTNLLMFMSVSIYDIDYRVGVVVTSILNAVISYICMKSAIFQKSS
jgi:putative flippase GtrA|tara:strand:+ start:1662 stop:2060 length:399 start_codon:yes stop_codon:yes gene_type:complete